MKWARFFSSNMSKGKSTALCTSYFVCRHHFLHQNKWCGWSLYALILKKSPLLVFLVSLMTFQECRVIFLNCEITCQEILIFLSLSLCAIIAEGTFVLKVLTLFFCTHGMRIIICEWWGFSKIVKFWRLYWQLWCIFGAAMTSWRMQKVDTSKADATASP